MLNKLKGGIIGRKRKLQKLGCVLGQRLNIRFIGQSFFITAVPVWNQLLACIVNTKCFEI